MVLPIRISMSPRLAAVCAAAVLVIEPAATSVSTPARTAPCLAAARPKGAHGGVRKKSAHGLAWLR
jgi:hypothetical protein